MLIIIGFWQHILVHYTTQYKVYSSVCHAWKSVTAIAKHDILGQNKIHASNFLFYSVLGFYISCQVMNIIFDHWFEQNNISKR